MLAVAGARAVAHTADLAHLARELSDDGIGPVDGRSLAGAHRGNAWRREGGAAARATATGAGHAALEAGRPRAQSGLAGAAALIGPSAAASAAAGGPGAALDVVGRAGASARDEGSTAGGTLGRGNANTRVSGAAGATTVDHGARSQRARVDGAEPEEGRSRVDGQGTHVVLIRQCREET